MKRKRDKKIDLLQWGFEPRIFEQVPAHNLNEGGTAKLKLLLLRSKLVLR